MLTSLISAYALKRGLTYLKEHGTSVGFEELMPFETFKEFTDTSLVRAMEKKYIEEALRLLD